MEYGNLNQSRLIDAAYWDCLSTYKIRPKIIKYQSDTKIGVFFSEAFRHKAGFIKDAFRKLDGFLIKKKIINPKVYTASLNEYGSCIVCGWARYYNYQTILIPTAFNEVNNKICNLCDFIILFVCKKEKDFKIKSLRKTAKSNRVFTKLFIYKG